jgi:glycosyltransferase involved in cell wall biosynthesis
MKIAVVIPTYIAHIKYLESLLENISQQTRAPDLVIIRASSCKSEIGIKENVWPFPLKIMYTEHKQYAAQNRNEGADAVPEDFDAISFIDSDDLMYPRRLEMIEQFLKEGVDAVFHNCTRGPRETAEIPTEDGPMAIYDSICLQKESIFNMIDNRNEILLRPIPMDENLEEEFCIQFAHATVRKECFAAIRFDERAFRYEDAKFVSDIVLRRYKTVTLKNKLSHYTTVDNEEENRKYEVLTT